MINLLAERGEFQFSVSDLFQSAFLCPVADNVRDKLMHGWDDYNELYHCCSLIHELDRNQGLKKDYHIMTRGGEHMGVSIVSRGKVDREMYASSGIHFSEAQESILLFNYFHISPEARGNGEFWLKDVILPWYAAKGYAAMYLKSSHARAFSLYERLGAAIGIYTSKSDNGIHERPGKIFRIPLQALPGHAAAL